MAPEVAAYPELKDYEESSLYLAYTECSYLEVLFSVVTKLVQRCEGGREAQEPLLTAVQVHYSLYMCLLDTDAIVTVLT